MRLIITCCLSLTSSAALAQLPPGPSLPISAGQPGVLNTSNVLPVIGTITQNSGGSISLIGGNGSRVGAPTLPTSQGGQISIINMAAIYKAANQSSSIVGSSVTTPVTANSVPSIRPEQLSATPGTIVITGNAVVGNLPRAQLPGNPVVATRAVIDSTGQIRLTGNGN